MNKCIIIPEQTLFIINFKAILYHLPNISENNQGKNIKDLHKRENLLII